MTVRQEGIRIEVGRSVELDQVLKVSSLQETLTVTGESPVVDTVHAGTSTNFNTQLLENSPTTRNQFFDALVYAPAGTASVVNVAMAPETLPFSVAGPKVT